VYAVEFSPDGRNIVSGSSDRTLRLWDVASGASRALEAYDSVVGAVAFSPDGRHVVSTSDDNTLRLWEVADGRDLIRLDGEFLGVDFAPDGKRLVAGDSEGRVQLLDILFDDRQVMPCG
jgi:WD40 repeat protein